MNKRVHALYVGSMVAIVLAVFAYLSYTGYSYYRLPVEERFFHPQYKWFRPSGILGHGLGITGTLLILIGVVLYIARKHYGFMERYIRIKYLLEFHIFLCTLGPVLILFHTSFKFGGIASISFWSMVAVVASGVIGRFIYNQIPHSIEGRELGREHLQEQREQLMKDLLNQGVFTEEELEALAAAGSAARERQLARKLLKRKTLRPAQRRKILKILKEEHKLHNRIRNLARMQRLFKYWHVAHKPFAIIMLVIAILHVGVALALGYKWIF